MYVVMECSHMYVVMECMKTMSYNADLMCRLIPYLKGNVGLVFTNDDLIDIRDQILGNKKKAPAKAGAIAPADVTIPAQNTGLGPEKTSFFQALQIATKITKGTIEILVSILLI